MGALFYTYQTRGWLLIVDYRYVIWDYLVVSQPAWRRSARRFVVFSTPIQCYTTPYVQYYSYGFSSNLRVVYATRASGHALSGGSKTVEASSCRNSICRHSSSNKLSATGTYSTNTDLHIVSRITNLGQISMLRPNHIGVINRCLCGQTPTVVSRCWMS